MSGSILAVDISKVYGDLQLSQTDSIAVEKRLEIQRCAATLAGAAAGAPSSLVFRMAKDFGMTLIGFLHEGGFNIYSEPARIN